MLLALAAAAFAGPRPADPVEARLSWSLREARALHARGEIDAFRFRRPVPLDVDGLSVVIHGDPATLLPALHEAGFAVEAVGRHAVQAWSPWERLLDTAELPGATRVREPWRASAKEVVSEGYDAVMLQDWHDQGIDGTGVTVGVVDVGFAGWDSLGDELGDDVTTDFSRGSENATEHGAAVAEIVHDFVPGASLYLATFSTDVEFEEVLVEMADAGVDVINGSIGFDNVWHADGTSTLTLAVEDAVDAGVAYFAAAGNENDKYRVGELAYVDGSEVLAIGGEWEIWAYGGGFPHVSFRWSEPFGEAAQDIDLALLNEDDSVCAQSLEVQDGGGWPYEEAYAEGCDEWVRVVVYSTTGADVDGLEGYVYSYNTLDPAYWTDSEDLTLPGDTISGVSVGAYYADDDSVAEYSSRGPTNDGRTKPDVVAPTAVTTVSYGSPFEGSSSATPHAAGLGALWVAASNRHGEPKAMKGWMIANARDIGPDGEDNESGAGAIEANEPPATTCGCDAGGGAGVAGAGVLAAALLSRRRRR
ncbi:MAG: S8 family serine peptidase [Myxococcota bacterium]